MSEWTRASAGGPKRAERQFFTALAIVMLLLVFAGFASSFYLRGLISNPIPNPFDDAGAAGSAYFIVHGLIFSSWMLLYLTQTLLIGRGSVMTHRRLGQAALIIAPLVVTTGLGAALYAARNGFHGIPIPTPTFLAVPLFAMLMFAIFITLGWRHRVNAAAHKRYMLLGTMAIVGAGTARVPFLQGVVPPWLDATLVLLLPLALWDYIRLRRLHPVTLWGGLTLALLTLGAVPIGSTSPWLAAMAPLTD